VGDSGLMLTYDGVTDNELASDLSLPRVVLFKEVDSTMDVANQLAADGAPAGTLVLADAQLAGRGRAGRRWESKPGSGIWLTLVERVNDPSALDVLSLRIGLRAARALDRFATDRIGLKWPNDLYLGAGKVGGILVESRWRGPRPEWTAVGIGINVHSVSFPGGAALGAAVSRLEVLAELIPAVRAAASARGHLSEKELTEFSSRDVAVGRRCTEPIPGRVSGVVADGALLIATKDGQKRATSGSLLFDLQDT
jgi:BirA family biotin operon repressor/biotin-[acetyl-CoA-carboxylase] ligase